MRLMFVILTIILSGCYYPVVRDKDVYKHEVHFIELVNTKNLTYMNAWFRATCKCENGKWSASDCMELAKTVYVLQYRIPYHLQMMRYLAKISDAKPEKPKDWNEKEYCDVVKPTN